MSDQEDKTPEAELPIPDEIREWIKETAREICEKPKFHSEPDAIIEHGQYSIAGLMVCKEMAERLYRHLALKEDANDETLEEEFFAFFKDSLDARDEEIEKLKADNDKLMDKMNDRYNMRQGLVAIRLLIDGLLQKYPQ